MAANRILLSTFFILLICFSRNSSAQQKIPFLERKVTVKASNQQAEEILHTIEKQNDFTFSFNPQIFEGQKPLSIDANNKSVREILDIIFIGQVSYKQKGNHIILVRNSTEQKAEEESYFIISGYIKDAQNGNDVAEASVFDKKSKESAISNQYGYFKLRVNNKQRDKLLLLSVNKINYKDTLVYIRETGATVVNILIYPEGNQIASTDSSAIRDSLLAVDQLAFINMILSEDAKANTKNIKDTLHSKFQLSFLPFLGTNLRLSGNTVNDYSINILAGYSMGTRKMEVGGLVNIDRDSVKNIQMAGLANVTGGPVKGLQVSGLINFNMKQTRGCQFAGLINNNLDTSHATSFAGLVNMNMKSSGGFLAAGLMNLNLRESNSPEIAGLTNVSIGNVKGLQLSGLLNVCVKDIHGAQVSGLVNYANHVHGTQVGFLNISDSCSGVPVGFLSYVHTGYHELEISADETFPLNVSFRTGVRSFYNILTAGIKSLNPNENIWYFGYGIGSAINLGHKWNLNLDATVNQPLLNNNIYNFNPLGRFNLTAEKRFSKYFSIAAGPSFNIFYATISDPDFDNVLSQIPPSKNLGSSVYNEYLMTSWIGGKVALRFF